MAQKFYNESDIQAIASAIRAKNGLSSTYTVSQMASAIQDIPSGSGGGGNADIEDGLITRTLSTYENSRVTRIGNYVFQSYIALTSINFPSVTTIESGAFANCSALTSINFPSVITIEPYAFSRCSALTSVKFPQATTIGFSAFNNCRALTSVEFPKAITINANVFLECSALTSVSFPQVTSIGNYAFQGCSALTSVEFPKATTIGDSAFANCSNLTSVSFPQVTTIRSRTFYGCKALTFIGLGGEQSQSGQLYPYCFQSCYNLVSLTLSGSYIYSLSNSNAFTTTPIAGYSASAGQYGSIYVPAELYSQYISATNWAYFSSRIVSF